LSIDFGRGNVSFASNISKNACEAPETNFSVAHGSVLCDNRKSWQPCIYDAEPVDNIRW